MTPRRETNYAVLIKAFLLTFNPSIRPFSTTKRSGGTPILLLNELSTTNYADKRIEYNELRGLTNGRTTKRSGGTPILLLNELKTRINVLNRKIDFYQSLY
jgi:hypothetical protein